MPELAAALRLRRRLIDVRLNRFGRVAGTEALDA
jgi:hypothetical protein